MSTNTTQISQLIDRLWTKTQDGSLKWEQLSTNSYQCRLGDFAITLRGPPVRGIGIASEGTTLKVTRLNGADVATAGTSNNALAQFSPLHTPLSAASAQALQNLYQHITDRSQDLDELLKLL